MANQTPTILSDSNLPNLTLITPKYRSVSADQLPSQYQGRTVSVVAVSPAASPKGDSQPTVVHLGKNNFSTLSIALPTDPNRNGVFPSPSMSASKTMNPASSLKTERKPRERPKRSSQDSVVAGHRPNPSWVAHLVTPSKRGSTTDEQKKPFDFPVSPGSIQRQSSIIRTSPESADPTPTGSEQSYSKTDTANLVKTDSVDEFDTRIKWLEDNSKIDLKTISRGSQTDKMATIIFDLKSPPASRSNKRRHHSCEKIANCLKPNLNLIYLEGNIPSQLASVITKAPESVRTFDAIRLLTQLISQLFEGGYAKDYEERIKREQESQWSRAHWNDTASNTKKAKFLADEIKILTKEKIRKKAAGVAYHLLFDEHFSNTKNLPWFKVVALNMMDGKEQKTLRKLVKRVKVEAEKFKELLSLFTGEDPYIVVDTSLNLIKSIFSEKGFMDWDRSNREVAADVLKKILEETLVQVQAVKKPSKSSIAKRESSAIGDHSKTNSSKDLLTPEHLELLILINSGECSSQAMSYSDWHERIKNFFRRGDQTNIQKFLEPLPQKLQDRLVVIQGKKGETPASDKDKLQKLERLEKSIDKLYSPIKTLKDKSDEGIRIEPTNENAEYVENALLTVSLISLQMAQNMLKERVQLYQSWENRIPEQLRSQGYNGTRITQYMDDAIQPDTGAWIYFLTRYQELTTYPQVKQEFVDLKKNFNEIRDHELSRHHSHRRTASSVRSKADFNPTNLLAIAENVQREVQDAQIGVKEMEFMRNEFDRRRLFFAPWMRYFKKMYIDETPMAVTLEGSRSLRAYEQKKPLNTPKDDDSRNATKLKQDLIKRFKELLHNPEIYKLLDPDVGDDKNKLKHLRQLRKAHSKDYEAAKEQYESEIEQLYHAKVNHPRSRRLAKLTIEKYSTKLVAEVEQALAPFAQDEEKESGKGSIQALPKSSGEKELLKRERELIDRVFIPSKYDGNNKVEIVKIFEFLFCATLGQDISILHGVPKKQSLSHSKERKPEEPMLLELYNV